MSSKQIKLTNDIRKTKAEMDKLEKSMDQMKNAKVPTQEYAEYQKAVAQTEKQLNSLLKQEQMIKDTGGKQSGTNWDKLQYKIQDARNTLIAFKADMDAMESDGTAFTIGGDTSKLDTMQTKYSSLQGKLSEYQAKLREVQSTEAKHGTSAGRVSQALNNISSSCAKAWHGLNKLLSTMNKSNKSFDKGSSSARKYGLSIGQVVKSIILYQGISKILQGLTTNLWAMLKTNSQFSASIAQIKGNLLTAFQPIYSACLPAINALASALSKITGLIAQFTSYLFGSTVKSTQAAANAQYDQAQALKDTSKAAKDAKKQLSDIDELHNVSSSSDTGSSDSSATSIAPVFDVDESEKVLKLTEKIKDALQPTIEALTRLKTALQPFKEFAFQALKDFYTDFLSPVGSFVLSGDGLPRIIELLTRFFSNVDWPNMNASLKELYGNLSNMVIFNFQGLIDFFDYFLEPLAEWTFGEALPKLLDTLNRFMSEINYEVLRSSFINLWNALEPFAENIGQGLLWLLDNVLSPLALWAVNTLAPAVINALADAIEYVNDTVDGNTALSDFFNTSTNAIANFSATVGDTLITILTELSWIIETLWYDVAKPVIEFLGNAWSDLMDLISEFWTEYGKPIFENFNTMVKKMGSTLQNAWKTAIKPVWDTFMSTVDEVWTNHLKPFLSKFLSLVGKIVNGALRIYNEAIDPIVNWLIEILSPAFTKMYKSLIKTLGNLLGGIIDIVSDVIDTLGGIVDFITGVLTGDWKLAWQGIQDIFKGMWNGMIDIVRTPVNAIIDIVNGMISGIVEGINTVIRAVNSISFDLPEIMGGAHIGFNLKTMSAPTIKRIPAYANGTVVPANYGNFLSILGDNKREPEVVSPVSKIEEAVENVLSRRGNSSDGTPVQVIVQVGRKTIIDETMLANKENQNAGRLHFVTA